MSSAFLTLVRKDAILEWRQKHTLYGVVLYIGSTVFAVYMMAGQPEASVWNILFWLTQLFVVINSVARSFLQEPAQRFRYYYSLVRPTTFLLAKMCYSVVLQMLMTGISLALFALMLGWPLEKGLLFCAVAGLGSLSLSVVFTFLSAVAARAGQNAALMAILGFPLVTPVLLILSKLATKALSAAIVTGWWQLAGIMLGLDVLIVVMGLILFPFLWHE
ncbi:MAG: heme exporter protein CcmB [Bacteroidetes bacterium]|nr:heme exporter protein CcmB [Bacteroidota bacterium]MBS1630024.1 heme exporter protein CcmB [Bacteroidota bacterium]